LAVMASHRAEELRAAVRVLGDVIRQAMGELEDEPDMVDERVERGLPEPTPSVFDFDSDREPYEREAGAAVIDSYEREARPAVIDSYEREAGAAVIDSYERGTRPAVFDFEADGRLAA
ncbi:MAG TPA: hypothetical protein VE983_03865, partial [Solirubrobacteraceae bacterium]|nr:hypothetical protein [Solirubrobacteraceae bacterium]